MSLLYKRIHELESEPALSLAHNLAVDKTGNAKATKIQLSELSTILHLENILTVNDDNYTMLDNDGYDVILMNPTSADRTVFLPTVADNPGRTPMIMNISSTYHVVVDGEGAEVIYNQQVSFLTIELWLQYSFIKVISDNTKWIKVNSPYLHLLDEADRNGTWNVDVNPTTSWLEANLSALVPTGTLGLYGNMYIQLATDNSGWLRVRDGSSSEIDIERTSTIRTGHAASMYMITSMMIKATNGIFDYAEYSSSHEILTFRFNIWGWLL